MHTSLLDVLTPFLRRVLTPARYWLLPLLLLCLIFFTCRTDMPLLPALLMEFLRHNYSMVHIPWGIAHNAAPMKVASSWDTALPTMDAVTSPQLAYDLWTTEHIK